MDESESQLLLLTVLLMVLVAIISKLETALTFVNRSRIKQLVGEGSQEAVVLNKLLSSPQDILIIVKIIHGILLLLIGFIIGHWFFGDPRHSPVIAGCIIAFTMIFVILLETIYWKFIPSKAEAFVLRLSGLLSGFHKTFSPVIKVSQFVLTPFSGNSAETNGSKGIVTEDEIKMMVDEASLQGVLEEEEKEMIHSVFELGNTIAREIMVPRLDIVGVEINTPLSKVLDTAVTHGLSRLPVFEESVDRVVGIVHTKDLLSLLREKKMDTPLKNIIRPAYFTPGSKKIDEMLREMQKEKIALAIVVDEYGGTDGLVTIEDIIEEIVGEITDEYDKEITPVEALDDGSFIVDGKTIIEDVNDQLDISIPTEEFETVGGYVYGMTGHIPKVGEVIHTDSITITVEKVVRQRITKVRIRKNGNGEKNAASTQKL